MKAIYLLLVCVMLGSIVTSCSVEPVETKTNQVFPTYSTGDEINESGEVEEDEEF